MNPRGNSTGPGPYRSAALAQYRRRAIVYDLELALFEPIRRRAIAWLELQPGEAVLDVGCGTGLSLALLRQGIGSQGRIVGIEQSPEMIALARGRAARGRWRNVTLLCSPADTAEIPLQADAALFHFTHDVLRRPEAVAHVVLHLEPGARVVATGLKWARGWASGANVLVLPAALRSVSSLEGLGEPWNHLAAHTGPMLVQPLLLGAVYRVRATVAPRC